MDSEPIVENVHLEQSWVKDETMDITIVNVIQGGTVADKSFTMETETVLPVYANDFHRYGSLTSNDIQDDGLKRLMCALGPVAVTAE